MSPRGIGFLGGLVLSAALVGLLTLGTSGSASAGSIIYVKSTAGGANTGASWADAYKSLQTALAHATSGKQIWVAKGTYYPTANTDRSKSFNLKGGVAIYGGFVGGESKLSQRKPAVNLTILSGEIGAAGASDNSYHVVLANSMGSSAVLDGFKILGGFACGGMGSDDYGGGMYNWYGSPTLGNLTFSNNTAAWGGGMYNDHGSPSITNVTFSGNYGACGIAQGGAMLNTHSNPVLKNVTFKGNHAEYAGAILNSFSSPTLSNVTFSDNTATQLGGAIQNDNSNPTLRNVTFNGNSAGGNGDAIANGMSNPKIYNSVLWGDGTHEVYNSGSTPTIQNSIVKGGCPSGSTCSGVINADPKLGPLHNNGGFTQTQALGAGSAAIDAGNNATCAGTDQRGVHRPQGFACDAGAVEARAMAFRSVGAADGWVLESTETSGAGGSLDSAGATFFVGDDAANRQYRGLLSFNTAALPDLPKIVQVAVGVKRSSISGTNPFTTHGSLLVDIRKPFFGPVLSLQAEDFQAAPNKGGIGAFGVLPVSSWYRAKLTVPAFTYVSRNGTTQLRLRFTLDDNNDHGADYVRFFSGDAATSADRPVLWVYYEP